MSGRSLREGVESPRPISTTAMLAELHRLLGQPLLVNLIVRDAFGGVNFISRLKKVEPLLPEKGCLVLVFENWAKIDIDPAETGISLGLASDGTRWLELSLADGAVLVTLEPVAIDVSG